jgi:hypothetical protein
VRHRCVDHAADAWDQEDLHLWVAEGGVDVAVEVAMGPEQRQHLLLVRVLCCANRDLGIT